MRHGILANTDPVPAPHVAPRDSYASSLRDERFDATRHYDRPRCRRHCRPRAPPPPPFETSRPLPPLAPAGSADERNSALPIPMEMEMGMEWCDPRSVPCPFHFQFHFQFKFQFYFILYHSIPFHPIPFHSIPFHSIPFHFIPFHSTHAPDASGRRATSVTFHFHFSFFSFIFIFISFSSYFQNSVLCHYTHATNAGPEPEPHVAPPPLLSGGLEGGGGVAAAGAALLLPRHHPAVALKVATAKPPPPPPQCGSCRGRGIIVQASNGNAG